MNFWSLRDVAVHAVCGLVACAALFALPTRAAESAPALLDILLENGSITQEQYETLTNGEDVGDAESGDASQGAPPPTVSAPGDDQVDDGAGSEEEDDGFTTRVGKIVAEKIAEEIPINASYGSKGFRFETRDGNWQTNLQWRFQFRFTYPHGGDPRQVDDFSGDDEATFQARRLRMKIGGHGYRPWLKYYFEVDLQPSRDADDSAFSSSSRVIDWRVDVAKYKKFGLRVGQWKIDYNRERVDSSGRQQFVERSIVNRIFTLDRQAGVSLRGHLFEGTPGDLRYFLGAFTGEGRGVTNTDNNMMFAGRLQWNFLGRDLGLSQTDVERTEKPTASLAVGAATHKGVCTRWSSSGCGSLDGFTSAATARQGQFQIYQAVQEFAFKWQGLSIQQEFHWKRVMDRTFATSDANHDSDFYGLYVQSGYFFNGLFDAIPEELELAVRYAQVREPNEVDRLVENFRQEYTAAANWFFAGHNNKLTLDYSYLTLDDDVLARNVSDHRVRLQWDISF